MRGWISLHRQIINNDLWNDKPFAKGQAWIDLLLLANHEDATILFNGKPLTIKRGSFLTSQRILAERWGWSRKKVSRFLIELQNRDQVGYHKLSQKGTVISIEKYSDFQEMGTTKEPRPVPKWHTNNKVIINNKGAAQNSREENGLVKRWNE